jgi:hypothetical protein
MAPQETTRPALTKEKLQEGTADTVLNAISILSEIVEDFRNSDRFFKYKAMVLSVWLLLCLSTFAVACPRGGPTNDIGAHLVAAGDAARPIFMVKNESTDVWHDVEVIVNGEYRSTLSQVDANGGSITLSPAVLYDTSGNRAPVDLRVLEIEVRVNDPEGTAELLRGGAPLQ